MSPRRDVLLAIATTMVVAVACAVVSPASAVVAQSRSVPSCHGHRATIFGSGTLVGTAHRDVIVGTLHGKPGSAYQLIRAGAGNDLVCAGPAGSRVFGGKGDDRLFGQGDFVDPDYQTYGDFLNGGPGDDLLSPGFDPNQTKYDCVGVTGSPCGGQTFDQFSFGGASRGVTVDLKAGLASGQGHDRLVVTPGWDILEGSAHADVLRGTDANDRIWSGAGADVVRGRGGGDEIGSDSGDDILYGGSGSDILSAHRGKATIFGGPGDDSLNVSDMNSASDTVAVSGGGGDDIMSVSSLHEGDHLNGDAGTDVLFTFFGFDEVGRPISDSALVGNLGTGAFNMDGEHATYQNFEDWWLNVSGPIFITGSDGPDHLRTGTSGGLTAHLQGGNDEVIAESYPTSNDFVDGGSGTDFADLGGGSNVCTNVEDGPC